MKKFVATIVDGDPTFQPVRDYYRMFPQEPSTALELTAVGIPIDGPIISIPDMTFEKVIDKMVEGSRHGFMTFLLIEHGHFLGSWDNPVGFTMPVSSDSSVLATQEVFVELRRLKQLQPDFTKDIDPKQVKDLQTSDGVLKASILLRLDHKLRQFRNSGIAEVEIRACNLGANRAALAALGDILDILAISAPKVGMFYARVNPAPRNNFFRSVRTLRQWTKRPPGTGASLFLDGPGDAPVVPNSRRRPGPVRHGETGRGAGVESGGGLALRVSILGENHDHIITDSAAAPDWGAVSRFVARNIMSPSRYSGNGPFFIAGMETRDSQGRPFTLPLDPNYKASLVTYLPPFKSFRG
ncbi:MAG TPA: hypothetical protein VGY91_14975 [Chthoniobacterales bacterium]|nr:hypothetical protein [Chthoniobacterales bacterium]